MAQTHLVTDCPSFLGTRVVSSILEDPTARVICVVPPENDRNEALAFGEDEAGRVEFLQGRASSMHLGLSGAEYRRLRREVRFIHHLPRLGPGPKGSAEAVQAVDNVLELAEECEGLERLIHVSPTPPPERGALLPLRLSNSGEAVRARIEARLEAALGRLPATIFRPHRLLGDSRTGEFVPGNISLEFALRWAIPPFPVPLPPPGFDILPFQAVPADWVARTSLRLGRESSTLGRIVRLVDPEPVPLGWVWREVARRLGRRSREPLHWILGLPLLASRFVRPTAARREERIPEWLEAPDVERCPSLPTYLDRLLTWAESQLPRRDGLLPAADPFE